MKYYFFYENNVPFSLLLVRPLHGKYHTKTTCNYNEPPRSKLRGISRLVAALKTKQASGNITRRDLNYLIREYQKFLSEIR
jgi:hypothetical protein